MLDEDALTFGVWLQHRRIALHLTQKQLGQLASCSAAMIRKIEADERLPSRDVAQHLATALQISGHDLAAFLRFARGELLHDPFTLPEIAAHPPRRLHAPTDVPIPPNALIGRQDEVTKVVALLKQPDVRLVTLTGPGGVGKTRLSIAIATTLRDVFVDGIVFVNLAPISDPALVIATIATALDVKEVTGRSLLVSVQAYLRDRRLLLLLDNFEQVLEGARGCRPAERRTLAEGAGDQSRGAAHTGRARDGRPTAAFAQIDRARHGRTDSVRCGAAVHCACTGGGCRL